MRLDGGTTVVAHNVTLTTLVVQTQSGTTAPASVQYTDTERTSIATSRIQLMRQQQVRLRFIIEYVADCII